MAIYHLTVKPIQRSKGKNAVASAAYRRAACLYSEREERYFNYTNKKDVIHNELIIPPSAPKWAQDIVSLHEVEKDRAAEDLWNLVENTEIRKDAQVAREIEFSLPIELTQEQNILLAREFITDQFALRGMVCDWNFHNDEGNPHVHVMLTMRELNEQGFGQKVTAWNSKLLLNEWRAKWAEYANFHLKLHGHNLKIDHRSYEEQGVDLVPGIHLGKAVTDMERRGQKTDIMVEANHIRRENLRRICQKPEVILDKIILEKDNFTLRDLSHNLGGYINDRGSISNIDNTIIPAAFFNNVDTKKQTPVDFQSQLSSQQVEHSSQDSKEYHLGFDSSFEELDRLNLEASLKKLNVLTPDKIAKIFTAIEHHHSAFSDKELAQALSHFTDNSELFAKAVLQIKASSQLLYLGVGDDGYDRYTTQKMFNLEKEAAEIAEALQNRKYQKIRNKEIDRLLGKIQKDSGKELREDQRIALQYLSEGGAIRCLVAPAGSGKSFLLGVAKPIWESKGHHLYGVALSGVASDSLNKDADIDSRTIDSFKLALAQGKVKLNKKSIVAMDESGMTDINGMLAILRAVRDAGAKLIVVGDPEQLSPVGPGAIFRSLLERIGYIDLTTVNRQKIEWQREATLDFANSHSKKAISAYMDFGKVHLMASPLDAMNALVQDWQKTREAHQELTLRDFLVVAHRNTDIDLLNHQLRTLRIDHREIAEGYRVKTNSGEIKIAEGDRIIFLKNDSRLGVKNGRFATIKSVSFTDTGLIKQFSVILDGDKQQEVTVDPSKYNQFNYGYAATVHKIQGGTVNYNFVYAGGHGWNRNLTHVAMTRHKDDCHVYADQLTFKDEEALLRALARYSIKDSVLDYPLAFAERRGVDVTPLKSKISAHLTVKLDKLREKVSARYEQLTHPKRYHERLMHKERLYQEAKARQVRNEEARLVASYADLQRDVGIAWQVLEGYLEKIGYSKIDYTPEAFSIISASKAYQDYQSIICQRNATAALIMKEPERYQHALDDVYAFDRAKLLEQAEAHACRERVIVYQKIKASGAIIHRDKQALSILQTLKTHYPHLKANGVDVSVLKQEAIAHLRRTLLLTLTPEEREAFRVVESYRDLVQKSGKFYTAKIKPLEEAGRLVPRNIAVQLESINTERDRVAQEIIQNIPRYDIGLNFYQIGLAAPRYLVDPLTQEQMQKAALRFDKLKKSAERFVFKENVSSYLKAVHSGNTQARMEFAHAIKQDTKSHYAAMKQLGVDTHLELWMQIGKDNKKYEQLSFYKTLDLVERARFKLVRNYVDAKRTHALVWQELYESKKTAQIDDTVFYQRFSKLATEYTQKRDQLASEIKRDESAFRASLDYFNVKAEELDKSAYAHECYERIDAFKSEDNVLARAKLAKTIIEDPKAHAKAIFEQQLVWKDIYHFAHVAEQVTLFSEASQTERALMRHMIRHRKTSQKIGKLYAKLKTLPYDKSLAVIEQRQKMQRMIGKRDALASKIQEGYSSLKWMASYGEMGSNIVLHAVEKGRTPWEKIAKQAAQHDKRLKDIELVKEDYANALVQFQAIASYGHSQSTEKLVSQLLDWSMLRKEQGIDQIITNVLKQRVTYESALHALDLSAHQVEQYKNVLKELNKNAEEWLKQAEKASGINAVKMAAAEDLAKVRYIQAELRHTKSIEGTLAEQYLKNHRGLSHGLSTESLRFHPKLKNWKTNSYHPALIIVAKDHEKKVCAMQAIFLDAETANKADLTRLKQYPSYLTKDELKKLSKLSLGKIGEGALVHSGDHGGKIALAEGLETALSVADAHPEWNVYCTFGVGNFTKVALKTRAKEIVLCADNDGVGSGTDKFVKEAVKNISAQGIDVWVALPEKPSHVPKWDFNDASKMYGASKVREDLDKATLLGRALTDERLQEHAITVSEKMLSLAKEQKEQAETQKSATTNKEVQLKNFAELLSESQPIRGTIAESYLMNALDIAPLEMKAIRFHEGVYDIDTQRKHPALLVKTVGYNHENQIVDKGVQVYYLNKENQTKSFIEQSASYIGDQDAIVMLQKPLGKDARWFIAADLETGLVLTKAKPNIRVACLADAASFENIPIRGGEGKQIIFCANQTTESTVIDNAKKIFSHKGFDVKIMIPHEAQSFVSLMREKGLEAVQKLMEQEAVVKEKSQEVTIKDIEAKFVDLVRAVKDAEKQPYAYKRNQAKEAIEKYAAQVQRNKMLYKQIQQEKPELFNRIQQELVREKEKD